MSSVRKTLEEYFSSMNSISRKLMEDVKHEDKDWSNLSYKEKSDLQWRSLVERSVEEKYQTLGQSDQSSQCFPVLLIDSGEKLVIDEDTSNGRPFGSSWKDEHSSPFLWETKSQLNLHLLLNENTDSPDGTPRTPKTPRTPPTTQSIKKFPTPKATPMSSPKPSPALTRKQVKPNADETPPTVPISQNQTFIPTVQILNVSEMPALNLKTVISSHECVLNEEPAEVLAPPVENLRMVPLEEQAENTTPEIAESHEENAVSETSFELDLDSPSKPIPKTGFDFLDNW